MKPHRAHLALFALLTLWMCLAWPHLDEQFSTTRQTLAALAVVSWDERTAAEWPAGYRAAQAVARVVPPSGSVLVLAYTGPAALNYYQARFPYYLYPRRLRVADRTDAPSDTETYLVVFRDAPATLAREPFRGHWDSRQLGERTAGRTRLFAGDRVEVYR